MNKDIIKMLLSEMSEQEVWFTTEHDPLYDEPSSYIKLNEYGELEEKEIEKIEKEILDRIGDGAIDEEDAIRLWIWNQMRDSRIAYKDNLVTKFKEKPVIDNIEAYEVNVLTESAEQTDKYKDENEGTVSPVEKIEESVRTRLKEENTKSLNVISQKIQDPNFDSDSKEGQIVVRTQELFNVLSNAGYDVLVSFDNGESLSSIVLGQQGGQINITITETDKPLRAFLSGSIEITDETLKQCADIVKEISVL